MVAAGGSGNRNFPASGGFQIDMLKTHRVCGDDFYRGRDFLEKPGVQPVCQRDKQGVGSFGCAEQLLLGERTLIQVSSSVVIAINTVFNFLRVPAGYHQNRLSHTCLLTSDEDDARSAFAAFSGVQ